MNIIKLFLGFLVLAGVYTQSHSMDTAVLYKAIVDGNLEQLKSCTAKDITFNPNDTYDVTGYTLSDGRFFIPSAGVQGLGQETIRTFSPLHLACQENQLAVVRLLVEKHGAAVNEGAGNSVPLNIAINEPNVEMANYLISKGAKLEQEQIDRFKRWAEHNQDEPAASDVTRIVNAMQGTKVVAGVPMTRMNVGILVAGIAVCAVAGKYLYNRYYDSRKKADLDDEEEDAQDENETVITDQKAVRA